MDLFELFPTEPVHHNHEVLLDEEFFEFFGEIGMEEEDYRDYLQKESRILSLVKKKKTVQVRYTQEDSFLKAIRSKMLKQDDLYGVKQNLLKMAVKFLVEPVLSKAGSIYEKEGLMEEVKALLRSLFPNEEVQFRDATPHEERLVGRCHTTRMVVPCLVAKTSDMEFAMPLKGQLRACYRNSTRKLTCVEMNYIKLMDAVSISKGALISYVEKSYHAYIQDMTETEKAEDHIVQALYEEGRTIFRDMCVSGTNVITLIQKDFQSIPEELISRIEKIFEIQLAVDDKRKRYSSRCTIQALCFFFPELKSGYSEAIPDRFRLAVKYLYLYCEAQEEEKKRRSYLKDLASSAARVYETKKNISEKYIRAMKKSRFNEMFGYVEFDTDCELKLIAEIEKEFLGFCQEYFSKSFGDRSFTDHAIRFRKLGRHHAWGLYFPTLQCLCVDIRHPGSFIHEFLHMIDFTSENPGSGYRTLSERHSFYEIRTKYEACLRKYIEEEKTNPIAVQLIGNTKYNLDYYLEPTEIFARCGEIFFRRILNVNSSLLNECHDFCYPTDQKLEEAIIRYYQELLQVPIEIWHC